MTKTLSEFTLGVLPKFIAGDRVKYSKKFFTLCESTSAYANAQGRRGTVVGQKNEWFVNIHWDDFEDRAKELEKKISVAFVARARKHGIPIHKLLVAKAEG